jgi:hypothetical protein
MTAEMDPLLRSFANRLRAFARSLPLEERHLLDDILSRAASVDDGDGEAEGYMPYLSRMTADYVSHLRDGIYE